MRTFSDSPVPTMVSIADVSVVADHCLAITFSNGQQGVHDFRHIVDKPGMKAKPLSDPSFFARVFIEDGVLTWPNGYDWDPIALHDVMRASGAFERSQAAE